MDYINYRKSRKLNKRVLFIDLLKVAGFMLILVIGASEFNI